MKAFSKLIVLSALAVIVGGMAATDAMAAPRAEASFLTVTEPLDVGGTVLQPGQYVIRVLPSNTNRNILQVTNEDMSEVFATVLSIPHAYDIDRDEATTEFVYYPATENSMRALRTWFAPDSTSGGGHDLVYPEGRAMQLAAGEKVPVVAYKDGVKPEELEIVELEVVTPEKKVVKYVAPKPKVVAVRELPRTASRTPLLGLLGLLMIGAAVVVRSIRIA